VHAGFLAATAGYVVLAMTWGVPMLLVAATVEAFGNGVLRPHRSRMAVGLGDLHSRGSILGPVDEPQGQGARSRAGRLRQNAKRRSLMTRQLLLKRTALLAGLVSSLAAKSAAAEVRLGFGADYLFNDRAAFQMNLQGDLPLLASARRRSDLIIAVTGRAGGLLTASPTVGAMPIDGGLRLYLGRVYIEGMGGPWIFFSGDAIRGHAAAGLGVVTRSLDIGIELGALSGSSGLIGARLALRL
jgi:hypothetical protein